jgi:hypothetical protein
VKDVAETYFVGDKLTGRDYETAKKSSAVVVELIDMRFLDKSIHLRPIQTGCRAFIWTRWTTTIIKLAENVTREG